MKELFLLPPLLVDCVLFAIFASGFLPGRTPILTVIARQARSHEIDAKTIAYSRKATAAWAAMSGLLGLFFATALILPALRGVASVAAFFQFPAYICLMVAEYRVRRR